MVDDTTDDAIALQLPQLLDQHFLRDRGDGPLKIGEAKHLDAEQVEENDELPAALQELERLLNAGRSSGGRMFAPLT